MVLWNSHIIIFDWCEHLLVAISYFRLSYLFSKDVKIVFPFLFETFSFDRFFE